MDNQQRIEMIRQMIDEKINKRNDLRIQLENIQNEMKQVELAITAFQNELELLTGEKVDKPLTILRGQEIGEAAIEALERLGGKAHYQQIKEEVEKAYEINGINEKSKADSVWNHLNRRDEVIKLGKGEFRLTSKYSPITDLLNRKNEHRNITLTFDEIEELLKFKLPASAYKHNSWWANEQDGNHSHARSWLSAGWKTTDVELGDKITFIKQ
ncbi:hypothetical protein [Paenibacillus sp. YYML68]|uniref:DUF7662 domain-containing protein n=1 Tax=Paenibacillus sp. YYML68 TaxID=2909250 RepID=UPI002493505E|nr:hypothetical protein [Paenibacillus sp. YYML68]